KHFPSLRFFDVLLGDTPALEGSARYYQRLVAGDSDEAALLLEDHLKSGQVEEIYDTVVLPALVQARIDREENRLDAGDERYIFRATRELLDHVIAHHEARGEPERAAASPARVLGCPARGRLDVLGLELLKRLLRATGRE